MEEDRPMMLLPCLSLLHCEEAEEVEAAISLRPPRWGGLCLVDDDDDDDDDANREDWEDERRRRAVRAAWKAMANRIPLQQEKVWKERRRSFLSPVSSSSFFLFLLLLGQKP